MHASVIATDGTNFIGPTRYISLGIPAKSNMTQIHAMGAAGNSTGGFV